MMKKIIGSLLILPILLWMTVPVAFAGGSAISAMSEIVMHLQHYPSSSEKGDLSKITQTLLLHCLGAVLVRSISCSRPRSNS